VPGQLDGHVTLVTGGGSGIGRGIVERFVAEGGKVGVLDLSKPRLEELREQFPDGVVAVEGTVASIEDNKRAVHETVSKFGRLDTFIGNAAIFDQFAPLVDMPDDKVGDAFDELFGVNVKGYLLGAKAALRALVETQGSIILTASYASFHPAGGGSLYTSSKHAVAGLVRQLAYELAPKVRVNGIAPGIAPTNLRGVSALGQGAADSIHPDTAKHLPLQFIPAAEDYASVFLFLAKKELSKMITGSIVVADSGVENRGLSQPAGGLDL
jgi:NAD(P)-dependent dehydrogenase (short-subunit alcohol dehydrogenase family)